MYRPDPNAIPILDCIVGKLNSAKPIHQQFVTPPAMLCLLPTGELYIDSALELDTDGWPEGKGKGDKYWQPHTSLRYADHSSINANKVPYFVLPLPATWPGQFGIALGDYAAVIFSGKLTYGVFADQGPPNKIGEGSIQLLRQLGEERIKANGQVLNAGTDPGVITIVFPGSGSKIHRTNQATLLTAITAVGKSRFDQLKTAGDALVA